MGGSVVKLKDIQFDEPQSNLPAFDIALPAGADPESEARKIIKNGAVPLSAVKFDDEKPAKATDLLDRLASIPDDLAYNLRAMAETGAGLATGMAAFPISKGTKWIEYALTGGDLEKAIAAEKKASERIQFVPTKPEARDALEKIGKYVLDPVFGTLREMGGVPGEAWKSRALQELGGDVAEIAIPVKAHAKIKQVRDLAAAKRILDREAVTEPNVPLPEAVKAPETVPVEAIKFDEPVQEAPKPTPAQEVRPAEATIPKETVDVSRPGEIVEPGATSGGASPLNAIRADALKKAIAEREGEMPKASEPLTEAETGIKNAVTEAERAAKGLDEVEVEARRSFGTTFDEGKRLVDSGEKDPRALARELADNPRPLNAEESATLIYDRMRLQNEHRATMDAIEKALKDGDTVAETEARRKLSILEEDVNTNDVAARRTGYEQGLGLAARRMMIKQDYSPSAMLQRARIDNGGKPVTPEVRAKYEALARQIEEANAKIAAHEAKIAELEASRGLEKIRADAARERRQAKRAETKQELAAEFTSLVKELNESLGGLHSGVDPTAALVLGKMAKNRVKSGVVTVEGIIDHIYTELKKAGIDLSKRDIRDAISGYGVTAHMSKEAVAKQLRELKRQMRLISALEDAKAGKQPLKSGLQREPASDAVRSLEKQVRGEMIRSGLRQTKEYTPEQQLRTFKTRTENRIKELEGRIERGDFSKKERRELIPDKEALDLQYQLDKAKRAYHEARMKDNLARRNWLQKAGGAAMEAINLSRAIKTSFDLSAVLRQGGFIALGHPLRAAKSIPAMFKALTKKGEFAVNQEILNRPNYRLYEQSKLYLAEHGQKLSQMEEAYMSRWAEKVPGVAASQRAYTTFLNKLRADSFDAMIEGLAKDGRKPTPEEAKAVANYINVATGRGNLGAKENALVGLNTVFFAPRYVASRFQLLAGQPLYRGSAATRKMVAKEYGRFLAGIGTVYALGIAAGGSVETDPRSADFGKIRFGNTRLDPLAGLAQVTVLVARLATGETKTTSGKVVPIRGDNVPYGGSNSADVIGRFMRSKLSPVVGTSIDVLAGKDVVGQKVMPETMPERLLMPLAFNDIYTAMKEEGVPAGSAFGILAIFGMGLQNYDPKRESPDTATETIRQDIFGLPPTESGRGRSSRTRDLKRRLDRAVEGR